MSQELRIERVWAMPSSRTFSIKPIGILLLEEMDREKHWIDPFCGGVRYATITNDLNPNCEADYHMDAVEFLKMFDDQSVDGVLYDPPYSVRQVSECYKGVGRPVTAQDTRSTFWTQHREQISRIVKTGGKVISFGWNSGGMGKTNGFVMTRILLVPHGGIHNDTIVTVEVKI